MNLQLRFICVWSRVCHTKNSSAGVGQICLEFVLERYFPKWTDHLQMVIYLTSCMHKHTQIFQEIPVGCVVSTRHPPWTDTPMGPGSPRDQAPPGSRPPRDQAPPCEQRQTGAKILPCPKLRLRAVIKSNGEKRFICVWSRVCHTKSRCGSNLSWFRPWKATLTTYKCIAKTSEVKRIFTD